MLVLTFRKILVSASQPRLALPLFSTSKSYLSVNAHGWSWRKLSDVAVCGVTLAPPAKSGREFYLLRDYHSGGDGRVWLACSNSGSIEVIKFLHEGLDAKQEVAIWHRLGVTSVFDVVWPSALQS